MAIGNISYIARNWILSAKFLLQTVYLQAFYVITGPQSCWNPWNNAK